MKNLKSIIKKAGAEFKGVMGNGENPLVCFNDPFTGSTLGLPESEVTIETVVNKIASSRAEFKAKEVKP